jgi:glyoxylase-like metal-dependent hydrolase (beta-lactamase superfamily II)
MNVGMFKKLLTMLLLLPALVWANKEDGQLEIAPFADNIWLFNSYMQTDDYGLVSSNGLVVVDEGDAYIIDTPWSEEDTEVLLDWIDEQGWHAKASISTHFHLDRSAGIAVLNARSIDTYASQQTNQLLKLQGWPMAKNAFDGDKFVLLEGAIEAYYPGPGHAMDNIVVWLPKAGVLDGGCMIRESASNTLGYTADGSVEDWADSVQNVIEEFPDIAQVIPGHGQPGGPELLTHTQDLARQGAKNLLEND